MIARKKVWLLINGKGPCAHTKAKCNRSACDRLHSIDEKLIPDPEFPELLMTDWISLKEAGRFFAAAKDVVKAKPIMVIPITKQRLDSCLVAFIFVTVFNSLLFMVV